MDQSNITKYHILFERMVRCTTDSEHFDREQFVRVLKDMSVLFRLSKGVTEYYRTERAEKDGEGEIMIDHDIGKKGSPCAAKPYPFQIKIRHHMHAVYG